MFDVCRHNNGAFCPRRCLSVSLLEITGTITDNVRSSGGKITALIIPAQGDSFCSLLSLPFQGNGNNFLLSVSLEASFSYSIEKCGAVDAFFLSVFRCNAWKPFDPQSRVLLTDWCFRTVTLAESPVFRGPGCHSGTNALEFSQIIPLCACLCVVQHRSPGKIGNLNNRVSVCLSAFC